MKNKFSLFKSLLFCMMTLTMGMSDCKQNNDPDNLPEARFILLKTLDGGISWSTEACYGSNEPRSITFSPPATYFIATMDVFYQSNDMGSTFDINENFHNSGFSFLSSGGRSRFCALASYLGHITYTKDNGASWIEANVPNPYMSISCIRILPYPSPMGYTGGNSGDFGVSSDTGATWTFKPLSDGVSINDIDYAGGGYPIFLACGDGKIRTSYDLGTSFNSFEVEPGHSDMVNLVSTEEDGFNLVCIKTNAIFYSDNGAYLWHKSSMPNILIPSIHNVCSTSTGIFAVGNSGLMLKSTDHGKTWQQVIIPNFSYAIMDIVFSDDQNGIAIALERKIR